MAWRKLNFSYKTVKYFFIICYYKAMGNIRIINIDNDEWTKIEGFSSKGLRVKSWYESVESGDVYLYKEPKIYSYPNNTFITKEIWTEFIACKIGQYIGLDVPDAIPAILDGRYGILIKNFLERGVAGMPVNDLIEAKEFLSRSQIEYPHNLLSIEILLTNENVDNEAWNNYLRMLIFDCLIGNNDRHDENWGLLYDKNVGKFKLAPIYDNASCLTSGETDERVLQLLTNDSMLEKYINNSRPPNLYKNFYDSKHYKHYDLMQYLIEKYRNLKDLIIEMLKYDYLSYTEDVVSEILKLDIPEIYQINSNRKALILKILEKRQAKLKDLIDVHN